MLDWVSVAVSCWCLSDERLEVESKKRKKFPTALEQGPVPSDMSVATAKSHVYMRN